MTPIQKQRWYTKITLKINPDFQSTFIALIDSKAYLNRIREGLIPTVYFSKTSQRLSMASNVSLKVQYKIPQGHICKDDICIKTSFLLVKNISHQIVLGTHFLTQLYPFYIDSKGLQTTYKNQEILFEFIKGIKLKENNQIQENTKKYENKLSVSIEDWEQYIKICEMPKQNIKEQYKVGNFEFKRDYRIEISENTNSLRSETETIELLDLKDSEQQQKEKYKILHIGAIQVAAKTLTRLGLDKPICICLRDAKHNQFQDS